MPAASPSATPSKSRLKQAPPPQVKATAQPSILAKIPAWDRIRDDLVPIAGIYLLLVIFFAPVVFQGMGLSPAADMVASAGMYRAGEDAIHHGRFPLWNPTLFAGLPMFASLQYALFVYPPEFIIRVASYIFGGGDWRVWLFHYFIAGIFAYLLARHYRCGRLAAWLSGAAYAFSPQLIVLADVGHGSKLMAMTWLPLIWLLLERLREKVTIGRAAALGAVFAIQILALHPQVAAYGAMLMGLYLVYWGIVVVVDGKKETLPSTPPASGGGDKPLQSWYKLVAHFAGAMALALALSAVLWMSVLDYAKYSTRGATEALGGGPSGGGVSWDYATGWSFHPLESITFAFPSFFGFGNETYWGTVGTPDGTPFTHNPMYFGVVVLFLAIMGMCLTHKRTWGYALTLALAAWVLSFGRYLPILYGPFFHLLPMFNKFRAPVMGQVLLLLPMALLAGVGLQALLDRVGAAKESPKLAKISSWVAGIAGVKLLLILAIPPLFASAYAAIAAMIRPGTQAQLLEAARELARPDVIRVLIMLVVLKVMVVMALRRKLPAAVLGGAFLAAFVIDIWPVDRKLANFTPQSTYKQLFQADGTTQRLLRDSDKFRIAPLDNRIHPANWWSYFSLESIGGYFGAKPAAYQKLSEAASFDNWQVAMTNPRVLDALNVRYVISSAPLDMVFEELQKRGAPAPERPASLWRLEVMPKSMQPGAGLFVYRNPGELPRARLVGEYRVIPPLDQTIAEMTGKNWDPHKEALLDREPSIRPEPGEGGSATISDYKPEQIKVAVSAPSPKLLILADEYYPSGWIATIDGKPAEILRADAVTRAVAIPAGEHSVEFTFRPKMFYAGLWTSLISLLLVIGLAVKGLQSKGSAMTAPSVNLG